MDEIVLNFVTLMKQNKSVAIYRKHIIDRAQEKHDADIKVKLPRRSGKDE